MSQARMPILGTGGAGYIGSYAVLELLDAGWPMVALDNLVTGFRWAVDRRAVFIKGDIGDPDVVKRTLFQYGIGAILYFAGSVVVPESVADPLRYYRNNTVNSRTLIAMAAECGIRHFTFSSTAAVYGATEDSPVLETMPTVPINPYGTSKLMTEFMLKDTASAYPFNYCALRYFNVAGADPDVLLVRRRRGATHLIKIATEAATGKRSHVNVYGTDYATPDGTGVRDYIHVSDLVAAHRLALEALIGQPDRNYVLNCEYGRGFSVLEAVSAVEAVSRLAIRKKFEPRRSGDPDTLIAANAAIVSTLAWVPRFDSINTIVRHALAWESLLDERRMAGEAEYRSLSGPVLIN